MKEWIIFMCLIAILAFFFGILGYLKGWNKGFYEGSEFSERKWNLAFKVGELKGITETQIKILNSKGKDGER